MRTLVGCYFASLDGTPVEFPGTVTLGYLELGALTGVSASAAGVNGLVLAEANTPAWLAFSERAPAAEWELQLPDTALVRDLFKAQVVTDVLFIVAITGILPAWIA